MSIINMDSISQFILYKGIVDNDSNFIAEVYILTSLLSLYSVFMGMGKNFPRNLDQIASSEARG